MLEFHSLNCMEANEEARTLINTSEINGKRLNIIRD